MALLLLLVMLTACAAVPQDLSGKMFNFPEQTNTAYVRLIPSRQDFSAVSVCLRFFTNLSRDYSLFSLASTSGDNDFVISRNSSDKICVKIKNNVVFLERKDFKLNTWHSVCSTWDSESELAELWFDGKPPDSTSVSFGSIKGPFSVVLGQEQDSRDGGINQSFVCNMSDVHMWDFELSLCEIQDYMNHLDFPPGNVLNWSEL